MNRPRLNAKPDVECFCEHSEASFDALIDAIMALGYDEATAAHYAMLVGDTPCYDEEGKIVVVERKTGQVLAHLDLDFFDRSSGSPAD